MTVALPPPVRDFVSELIAENPDVVWLAGSWARGDTARFSDIDLGVIGSVSRQGIRRAIGGRLVSVSFTTEAATRASFGNPAAAGAAIPGWRNAVLLHDAVGTGAALVELAERRTWDEVSGIGEWVRRQVALAVEGVLKLLNGLERKDEMEVRRQSAALVEALVRLVSVQSRLLYDSESRLYTEVGHALGKDGRALLGQALGNAGDPTHAKALFSLFSEATDLARPDLDDPELELLALARHCAGEAGLL